MIETDRSHHHCTAHYDDFDLKHDEGSWADQRPSSTTRACTKFARRSTSRPPFDWRPTLRGIEPGAASSSSASAARFSATPTSTPLERSRAEKDQFQQHLSDEHPDKQGSDSHHSWKRQARRTRRGCRKRGGASARKRQEESADLAEHSDEEERERTSQAAPPDPQEEHHANPQEESDLQAIRESDEVPHLASTLHARMSGLSGWALRSSTRVSHFTPYPAHDDPHDSTFTLTSRPHGSLVQEVTSLGNGLSRRGDRSVEKPREESQQPEDGERTGLRAAESRRDNESSEGEVV